MPAWPTTSTVAGFYANVIFAGTPAIVAQLRHKFALNDEMFRVLFTARAGAETREVTKGNLWPASTKSFSMGNLTRDPELRYTPKGTAIAKIGLAVNRDWTTETGEKKEEVTFVDVDAFGSTAETIGQYMRKGTPDSRGRPPEAGPVGGQADRPEAQSTGRGRGNVQFLGSRPVAVKAAHRPQPRAPPVPPPRPARPPPNPWKATVRPKATTFRFDFSTPQSGNFRMAKTEVILTHNIVGLGGESDQVRVAAGYARNYLFPQDLAMPVTSANKRRLNRSSSAAPNAKPMSSTP